MVDIKVQQVQKWLLSTYGDRSEFAKFVRDYEFEATGETGNNTMVALVMALQYELGIEGPSGSFGPTTIRLAPKISLANANTFSTNIIKILEGGLWCHGYSAGYNEPSDGVGVVFGGTYDEDTDSAVKKLQSDIGISQSGRFDGYLWKALLSTDAFVTTWTGGSAKIREAQQYLNSLAINGYYFADDFMGKYLPTDGLNNRSFSNALILYIQANLGIFASDATGNLGPATQAGLVTIPDNLPSDSVKSRHFVRAAVFALLANGYDLTINSYWSQETSNIVSKFQKDMLLSVTGKIDFPTWMALLISHGDKNRRYNACDTRFEITTSRITKLKEMGVSAVGRYINGTDFKVLREGEVERIIDSGLALIPIYQESGTSGNYFSESEGKRQGTEANKLAIENHLPFGSIIYFAVDYDAQEEAIHGNIIPYFKGVSSSLLNYKVGVYGTRNVCQKVTSSNLAETSYVSNMSSGFSGNLGFKMPENWNLDQFDEIQVDDWAIDKVIYSGKFDLVTEYHLDPQVSKNYDIKTFITYLKRLEDTFIDYRNSKYPLNPSNPNDPNQFIHDRSLYEVMLNLFRHVQYGTAKWDFSSSSTSGYEQLFFKDLETYDNNLYNYFYSIINKDEEGNLQMITDLNQDLLDIPHYFYTCLSHCKSMFVPSFWSGWGGDVITLASDLEQSWTSGNYPGDTKKSLARKLVGGNSSFNRPDVLADVDAVLIGNKLLSTPSRLSKALSEYHLTNEFKKRFKKFSDYLLPSSTEASLAEYFDNTSNGFLERAEIAFTFPIDGYPDAKISGLRPAFRNNATDSDITIACEAFAWYLKKEFI